ncbi:uncharacterized protein LOC113304927 [Papaver somniferum]|uniref:uncharacterized protein LOC113304927 n=1 Tax=Papaver somniferum TaxID=3469 RepID=UPI000E702D92|nr:uncharacterized protein LOC113304927 [Papaver somniferum]
MFLRHAKSNPLSFKKYPSPYVNLHPLSKVSTIRCAAAEHPSSHSVDPQVNIVTKNPIIYALVDAFTDKPFKGNPAAVCLLEDEDKRDDGWFIGVASEFNAPITCFLSRIRYYKDNESDHDNKNYYPIFNIRWFTSITEVNLSGHGTLAAAQYLFTRGLVKADKIVFVTLSGITLTVKKILACRNGDKEDFSIEMDFPSNALVECNPQDIPNIPLTLNGVSVLNVKKTGFLDDVLIEVSSGQSVIDLKPNYDELQERKGRERVIYITGKAPEGSGFDFISRVFGPTIGVLEDQACGSCHCALTPYWGKKLGKTDLRSYMASPRGGVFDLHLDEENGRVKIRGKAFTVMQGSLFAQ